jgi:hypothetical protein
MYCIEMEQIIAVAASAGGIFPKAPERLCGKSLYETVRTTACQ